MPDHKHQSPIAHLLWGDLTGDIDAAADRLWDDLRDSDLVWDCLHDAEPGPYRVQSAETQDRMQLAVLHVLHQTVPDILRERARSMEGNGAKRIETAALRELAEDMEGDQA